MTISIILVDDHPVVRSGIRAVLASEDGLTVVGEAGNGIEALTLCRTLRPNVVLCDLRLGDGPDGVAITASLRALDPAPAVIILTTYDNDNDILRAVEAGAAGYLLKDVLPTTIVNAIHDAAAGRNVWAPEMTQRILNTVRTPRPALTAREREVLQLLSKGSSNKVMAQQLFLTTATVKSHLVNIYTKLAAASRTQALAKARDLGMLDE